jgi:hypothetical protein
MDKKPTPVTVEVLELTEEAVDVVAVVTVVTTTADFFTVLTASGAMTTATFGSSTNPNGGDAASYSVVEVDGADTGGVSPVSKNGNWDGGGMGDGIGDNSDDDDGGSTRNDIVVIVIVGAVEESSGGDTLFLESVPPEIALLLGINVRCIGIGDAVTVTELGLLTATDDFSTIGEVGALVAGVVDTDDAVDDARGGFGANNAIGIAPRALRRGSSGEFSNVGHRPPEAVNKDVTPAGRLLLCSGDGCCCCGDGERGVTWMVAPAPPTVRRDKPRTGVNGDTRLSGLTGTLIVVGTLGGGAIITGFFTVDGIPDDANGDGGATTRFVIVLDRVLVKLSWVIVVVEEASSESVVSFSCIARSASNWIKASTSSWRGVIPAAAINVDCDRCFGGGGNGSFCSNKSWTISIARCTNGDGGGPSCTPLGVWATNASIKLGRGRGKNGICVGEPGGERPDSTSCKLTGGAAACVIVEVAVAFAIVDGDIVADDDVAAAAILASIPTTFEGIVEGVTSSLLWSGMVLSAIGEIGVRSSLGLSSNEDDSDNGTAEDDDAVIRRGNVAFTLRRVLAPLSVSSSVGVAVPDECERTMAPTALTRPNADDDNNDDEDAAVFALVLFGIDVAVVSRFVVVEDGTDAAVRDDAVVATEPFDDERGTSFLVLVGVAWRVVAFVVLLVIVVFVWLLVSTAAFVDDLETSDDDRVDFNDLRFTGRFAVDTPRDGETLVDGVGEISGTVSMVWCCCWATPLGAIDVGATRSNDLIRTTGIGVTIGGATTSTTIGAVDEISIDAMLVARWCVGIDGDVDMDRLNRRPWVGGGDNTATRGVVIEAEWLPASMVTASVCFCTTAAATPSKPLKTAMASAAGGVGGINDFFVLDVFVDVVVVAVELSSVILDEMVPDIDFLDFTFFFLDIFLDDFAFGLTAAEPIRLLLPLTLALDDTERVRLFGLVSIMEESAPLWWPLSCGVILWGERSVVSSSPPWLHPPILLPLIGRALPLASRRRRGDDDGERCWCRLLSFLWSSSPSLWVSFVVRLLALCGFIFRDADRWRRFCAPGDADRDRDRVPPLALADDARERAAITAASRSGSNRSAGSICLASSAAAAASSRVICWWVTWSMAAIAWDHNEVVFVAGDMTVTDAVVAIRLAAARRWWSCWVRLITAGASGRGQPVPDGDVGVSLSSPSPSWSSSSFSFISLPSDNDDPCDAVDLIRRNIPSEIDFWAFNDGGPPLLSASLVGVRFVNIVADAVRVRPTPPLLPWPLDGWLWPAAIAADNARAGDGDVAIEDGSNGDVTVDDIDDDDNDSLMRNGADRDSASRSLVLAEFTANRSVVFRIYVLRPDANVDVIPVDVSGRERLRIAGFGANS